MATNWQDMERLRERETPYGLGVYPDKNLYEYTDPRNEAATVAHWQPVLERLGIVILGIRDVPNEPVKFTVDGIIWNVERLRAGRQGIPESTYHRMRAAEAQGIKFRYFLYGKEDEEQFDHPEFYPVQETRQTWQEPRTASWLSRFERTWNDWKERLKDPCVIGIIATAPNRGIWCLIGKWFE